MNQLGLDLGNELIIDLFAGGGGASEGIEQGFYELTGQRRPVDIAVNHDPQAVAMHQANHPASRHFCESVFKVHPCRVTGNRPVGLLWASPDCTHHSKAKGGKPVSSRRRGLAWVVIKWARRTRPRVIMLENVEEFADWGPLTEEGRPCPIRKGQTFRLWKSQLERLGYRVEHRELRACDYGAPTIRKRLFVIARRDGRPIVWPKPSHGDPKSKAVKCGKLQPWRTAAEIIDWSIPAPSIFERKRPLAANTMRRIARGIQRFVLDDPEPFLVGVGGRMGQSRPRGVSETVQTVTAKADTWLAVPFITKWRTGSTGHRADEPLHTVTSAHSDHHPGGAAPLGLVAPYFVPRHGEREGQDPRTRSVEQPLPTVTGTANGASLVAAFLAKHYGGHETPGAALHESCSTVTAKDHHALVAAHLINQKGSDQRARPLTQPGPTVCAGGTHAGLVAALMAPYYGSGSGETGRDLRDPSPTVTSRDRLQLIAVQIDGQTCVLTDIGMRMLTPRELYRAQGFPDSYRIDIDYRGKPLPKYAQVRMCGNSVPPPFARALVHANFAHELKHQESAAA